MLVLHPICTLQGGMMALPALMLRGGNCGRTPAEQPDVTYLASMFPAMSKSSMHDSKKSESMELEGTGGNKLETNRGEGNRVRQCLDSVLD